MQNFVNCETSDITNEQSFDLKNFDDKSNENKISNNLNHVQLNNELIFRNLYDSGNDTENENPILLNNNKKESGSTETKYIFKIFYKNK